jgi:tripartite motif-containing protein 71
VDSGGSGANSPNLGSPRSSISTAAGGNQYLAKKKLLFKFGSRGSDPGYFTWPRDVSVGPDGQIVVTDSSNHRIQVFTDSGAFLSEFGSYGSGEGELDCPGKKFNSFLHWYFWYWQRRTSNSIIWFTAGVCVNRIGQLIISDRYNHRIVVLDPSGRFLRAFGSQGSSDGRFNNPWGK